MIYAYFKIFISLLVPIAALLYARQARLQNDTQAVKFVIRQPLNEYWMLSHRQESLQEGRAEVKYLHRLIRDLDD